MRAFERELAERRAKSGVGYSRCPTSAAAVIPVLQALTDDGSSPISKNSPARVFIAGRGMVEFTLDDDGRVVPAVTPDPSRPVGEQTGG